MEAEDFETRLRVWVVRWLILQVLDSNLREEGLHDAEQVVETDTAINHDTFNLMELGQVSRIECLVPEDTVDGEVLHRLKLLLLSLQEKHLGADCGSMGTQDILHGLFAAPARAVPKGALKAVFVSPAHSLLILLGYTVTGDGISAEESVLEVTCWVTLRLEKRVEVPERALYPAICRHFIEAH